MWSKLAGLGALVLRWVLTRRASQEKWRDTKRELDALEEENEARRRMGEVERLDADAIGGRLRDPSKRI